MSVHKQQPSPRVPRRGEQYAALVEAAFAEPGEWFSAPTESINPAPEVYRKVGKRVAEVAVRGDSVYLRVLDCADGLAD